MLFISHSRYRKFYEKVDCIANKTAILFFIIFFFFVSYLNKYPDGYVYCCGDFAQLINFDEKLKWFTDTFIDYGEGAINHLFIPIYQYTFSILQNIVGVRFISIIYPFIFFVFSFFAFFFAALIYNERINYRKNAYVVACYSFLYAVNSYTCYYRFNLPNIFYAPYLYLPLLFAASFRYFLVKTLYNKEIFLCAVIYLASNFIWYNPSYFVAFTIILALNQLLVYLFGKPYPFKTYLLKSAIFYGVFCCVFSIYIIPIAPILVGYATYFNNHTASMLNWIASQAVPMHKAFALGERYYQNMGSINYFLISMISFLLFSAFIWINVAFKTNKKRIVYPIIILFIILLLNKGNGFIFQDNLYRLFNSNPLLSSLRSFDKVLIYLPYFLLLPFIAHNETLSNKKIATFLVATTIICMIPLLDGSDLKKYYRVYEKEYDYKTSKFSPLVKIPQGYFDASYLLNQSEMDYKLLSMPWSLFNKDLKGWVVFPKWKMIGANPITQFFNAPVVQMNGHSAFGEWNYGEMWNNEIEENSTWILPFAGLLNAKYIIYHKDIEKIDMDNTIKKIEFLVKKELIKEIYSDQYFDLYKIKDVYNLPHIYVPERISILTDFKNIPEWLLQEKNTERATAFLEEITINDINLLNSCYLGKRPVIEYKKVNSSKYVVKVHRAYNNFPIVLSETYSPLWKIYLKEDSDFSTGHVDFSNISISEEEDGVTKDELSFLLNEKLISDIGNSKKKVRTKKIWKSLNEKDTSTKRIDVDYISKPLKGTIQNNNLSEGYAYDTLFAHKIENNSTLANGYSNLWIFNLEKIRNEFPHSFKINPDGSCDFNIVIEFLPQKLLFIGKVITSVFCVMMLGAFITMSLRKRRIVK